MKVIEKDLLPIGIEALNKIFAYNSLDDLEIDYQICDLQQEWSLAYDINPNYYNVPIYILTCILIYQQRAIARYRLILAENKIFLDEFFEIF